MKKLLFVLVALLFVGCGSFTLIEGIETKTAGNFHVTKLFEHEGVTMYRFDSGTRTVYYGVKKDSVDTHYKTTEGKTTHHHDVDVIHK